MVWTNFVIPDYVADPDTDEAQTRAALWSLDFFESIRRACDRVDATTGCWIWQEGKKYPQLTGGMRLHRLVAQVRFGDIGRQHVHHMCGDATCVNPAHLQLVTREENTAEMLARHDYEDFIIELLERIRHYNPDDPILRRAMPGKVGERWEQAKTSDGRLDSTSATR